MYSLNPANSVTAPDYWYQTALVTQYPLTVVSRVLVDGVAAEFFLGGLFLPSGSKWVRLGVRGDVASDPYEASNGAGGTIREPRYVGATAGTLFHIGCVISSISSRALYIDGVSVATDSTSINLTGLTRYMIGANSIVAIEKGLVGDICECAAWSAALTDDEMAALAKGFNPQKIRPQSIEHYMPLVRTVQDVVSGQAITSSGTPTVVNHPRTYR